MNELNFQQEIASLCLQIITPIHIGDGTKLTAKEYFFSSKEQKAYFFNVRKWHQFIYQHGLFSAYEKYISNVHDKRNLLTWLEEHDFTLEDVKDIITRESLATVNIINVEKKNTLNDVDKHVHQLDGSLYVPGSSIKGAFRSAILYVLLKKNPAIKNRYWQLVNEEINKPYFNPRKSLNRLTTNLENDLLHTLQLEEKHKPVPSNNAVCSSLRGLQVSDTLRSENIQVAILQKIDAGFNKFGKAGFHPLPIFKECMLPGAKLMFDVKLDKAMMATVGINSIDDLLSITQQYIDEIIRILKDAFKKEHPDPFCGIDAANIFVGGNVGFHSKTLLALLAPDDNTAKNTIKVLLNKEFPKHEHIIYDKFASPRLLKCTIYNGELLMMGLAEVRRI